MLMIKLNSLDGFCSILNAKHRMVEMIKSLVILINKMRDKETGQIRAMIQVSNKKIMGKKMAQEGILSKPKMMNRNKAAALNQEQINNS